VTNHVAAGGAQPTGDRRAEQTQADDADGRHAAQHALHGG
jgi:hypothetical protein